METSVPNKIRMFLWRLAKHSLPTEDVRAHRNIVTSSTCGLCGVEDSWRHSLLECSMFRCIWAMVDGELAEHLCETTEPSAKQWLFSMIDTLSHAAFVRLAVTLWATWWARRKAIHEAIYQSPSSTHQFIARYLADLELLPKKLERATRQPRGGPIRPKAPPTGFSKIHVDAAVPKLHNQGAAAAVCRDISGNYVGSSALVIHGITDPTVLETIACREGLSLAQDLMLQNFVLVSDSKQVVDDIKKSSQGAHGAIITENRQCLLVFNCNITFEGRSTNKDADRLAKFAQSLDQGRHV